jgi:hypothetical protein
MFIEGPVDKNNDQNESQSYSGSDELMDEEVEWLLIFVARQDR